MRDALIGTREHAPTVTAKGDTSFHVAIPAGHGHSGMPGIIEHPPPKKNIDKGEQEEYE